MDLYLPVWMLSYITNIGRKRQKKQKAYDKQPGDSRKLPPHESHGFTLEFYTSPLSLAQVFHAMTKLTALLFQYLLDWEGGKKDRAHNPLEWLRIALLCSSAPEASIVTSSSCQTYYICGQSRLPNTQKLNKWDPHISSVL